MSRELTCAVVQLNSQDAVEANLAAAGALVAQAARAGATLVVLPENFAFMATDVEKRAYAETLPGSGPVGTFLSRAARELGVFLVGGGSPERSDDPQRPFNTSALYAPSGELVAKYRKVHLFDVDVPNGKSYRESEATSAGGEPVVTEAAGVKLGLSVCYDVRFPELYRHLAQAGARILTVPAAFTLHTGKDHWSVLLRARAVENQCFVLAAAQWGNHPQGRSTYGKSMIIDPWGDVLAQAGEGPGFALARLDFAYQDRVRAAIPCASHRRL